MKIKAAMHSSFPRIGEHPDEQKLRRAYAGLEEGKINKDEFTKIENDVIADVIRLQETSGLDILTDGLIRWYDPVSHLARNLKGFEINGLLRFFDTNFYYRQPVYLGELASGNGALNGEIEYAVKATSGAVKAVLLGPLSLAAMSLNKSSLKFEDFFLKIAEIIGQKISQIATKGVKYIQLDEPWLVRHPEQFDLFKAGYSLMAGYKKDSKLVLTFYFGDVNKIYSRLPEIPADIYGVDFTYSPGLLEKMSADNLPGGIAAGILDARNTKLEDASAIAKKIEPLFKKPGEHHVTTSCGLEYLPRNYAMEKLTLTAQVAKLLNG